ncbi:MAG: hypothetical protein ACLFPO_01140 [Spirochaetaceae bacterium]
MVRIAKQPDPKRIRALKERIQDERYLEAAIQRLAGKLTDELVDRREGDQLSPRTTSGDRN